MQFPVIAGDELTDLLLPFHKDSQRGGLHSANGGLVETASLGVEGRHDPGAIDADQPIRFRPAGGGRSQGLHLLIGAQPIEPVADGGGRHGLQPQTPNRLAGLSVLGDVAEDEFSLAAGVAGID